jgi:hypothetical protein
MSGRWLFRPPSRAPVRIPAFAASPDLRPSTRKSIQDQLMNITRTSMSRDCDDWPRWFIMTVYIQLRYLHKSNSTLLRLLWIDQLHVPQGAVSANKIPFTPFSMAPRHHRTRAPPNRPSPHRPYPCLVKPSSCPATRTAPRVAVPADLEVTG